MWKCYSLYVHYINSHNYFFISILFKLRIIIISFISIAVYIPFHTDPVNIFAVYCDALVHTKYIKYLMFTNKRAVCAVQVQHLVNCRQHSMGMGNLIKYIRYEISHIAPDLSEADAKVRGGLECSLRFHVLVIYPSW